MGMTIDEAIKEIESIAVVIDEKQALAFALAVHTMKKYQMLQADYEARLKADMVAMLTEIQLEIEEHKITSGVTNQGAWNECIACCSRITQQKINELKADQEGKE